VSLESGEPREVETTSPAGAPPGVYLTPKRLLIAMAIVLAAILIALILYLLSLQPEGLTTKVDAEPVSGIEAELIISGPGKGSEPNFNRPMAAAWSPDGKRVYVADSENNRICVFTDEGRFIREFGGFGVAKPLPGAENTWKPGLLNYPTDVAVAESGDVYVADFYNDSISVFNPDGEFQRRFPDPSKPTGKGSSGQDGRGIAVTALAVEGDRVYATDEYQVFAFSLNGRLLSQWGKPGKALGSLDHPNGIAVAGNGQVIVSDSNNNRVVSYSRYGQPMWKVGSRLSSGLDQAAEAPFVLPRGVSDAGGTLLVADPLAHQLVEVSYAGTKLQVYGERGTAPATFNFPNDVDWQGDRILVSDRENNRVQVVRLVQK